MIGCVGSDDPDCVNQSCSLSSHASLHPYDWIDSNQGREEGVQSERSGSLDA